MHLVYDTPSEGLTTVTGVSRVIISYRQFWIFNLLCWVYFVNFISALALSLPVKHFAGDNTNLPSNTNISKTVNVNGTYIVDFVKAYSEADTRGVL